MGPPCTAPSFCRLNVLPEGGKPFGLRRKVNAELLVTFVYLADDLRSYLREEVLRVDVLASECA